MPFKRFQRRVVEKFSLLILKWPLSRVIVRRMRRERKWNSSFIRWCSARLTSKRNHRNVGLLSSHEREAPSSHLTHGKSTALWFPLDIASNFPCGMGSFKVLTCGTNYPILSRISPPLPASISGWSWWLGKGAGFQSIFSHNRRCVSWDGGKI